MKVNEKKLILASGSPRRKEILQKAGYEFEIIPSNYDEVLDSPYFEYEKIEELAYQKALDVANRTTIDSIILGADTVVVSDNLILGKPTDEADAIAMLNSLSGKKHSVVTSVCAIDIQTMGKNLLSTTSYVEFNELSAEMIELYVKQCRPLDKAGSYGIQELPMGFVKNVEGSFENIVGLCPKAVAEVLKRFG